MFKLPIFEEAHPRFKAMMEADMRNYYISKGDHESANNYTYESLIYTDPELPEGFVYAGLNIEHDLHPCFVELTHDFKHTIMLDATNKKSAFKRNRKFDKVVYKAFNSLFDPQWAEYTEKPYRDTYILVEHGVADSAEQVYAHYKFLEDDSEQYFVSLTPIAKNHQPEDGGWRWHKWGPYIGNQKRSGCEYLYDEPDIDLVFVYHVYRFKDIKPTYESNNFLFVKRRDNLVFAYNKNTYTHCFTVDFEDGKISHIDNEFAVIPPSITIDNFVDWVELNYKETWL